MVKNRERIPFFNTYLDSGQDTEFHILTGIDGSFLFSGAARILTVTDSLAFYHMHHGSIDSLEDWFGKIERRKLKWQIMEI